MEEVKSYEESKGWKLYYSPEGYAYYFNEISGESEWAPVDHAAYSESAQTVQQEPQEQWKVSSAIVCEKD